jgi:hypothetical protein
MLIFNEDELFLNVFFFVVSGVGGKKLGIILALLLVCAQGQDSAHIGIAPSESQTDPNGFDRF